METNILDIPLLEKSNVTKVRPGGVPPVQSPSSCCKEGNHSLAGENTVQGKEVCCTPIVSTPGQSPEENDGACCAQPSDGSACCEK